MHCSFPPLSLCITMGYLTAGQSPRRRTMLNKIPQPRRSDRNKKTKHTTQKNVETSRSAFSPAQRMWREMAHRQDQLHFRPTWASLFHLFVKPANSWHFTFPIHYCHKNMSTAFYIPLNQQMGSSWITPVMLSGCQMSSTWSMSISEAALTSPKSIFVN